MNTDSTPMEATAEDIMAGIKNEKIVVIDNENSGLYGKAIKVRLLRAREYRSLTQRVHVSVGPNKDLDIGSAFALQYEACKIAKPPTILTPGILEHLDDMDPTDVAQIGDAILNFSAPKEDAVEDFSGAQTGS
jgi:hypothetical protein